MAKSSLTTIQRFVEAYSDHEFWVGIDVHKRSYHVALYRIDGTTHTFIYPSDPISLVQRLLSLNIYIASLTYEAGPTGFALARIAEAAGISVLVVAPSRIPRPVLHGAKTDRLDCIRLAEYAAKGMIKPIAIPTEEQEAKRSLLRRRHLLVDSIRKCKQRIKSHLLFLGIAEPHEVRYWSKKVFDIAADLPMDSAAHLAIESFLRELSFLQQELKTVEGNLDTLIKKEKSGQLVKYLKSVPGVGNVVATSFCLELFNPERFSRPEEVTSYLGLAPMVQHSGEKNPSGRLKPVGQKRLRSLLIEAAWVWRAKDNYAKQIYNRLLSKVGLPQKAITGLARRLAIILWRLCIEKRMYKTFAV